MSTVKAPPLRPVRLPAVERGSGSAVVRLFRLPHGFCTRLCHQQKQQSQSQRNSSNRKHGNNGKTLVMAHLAQRYSITALNGLFSIKRLCNILKDGFWKSWYNNLKRYQTLERFPLSLKTHQQHVAAGSIKSGCIYNKSTKQGVHPPMTLPYTTYRARFVGRFHGETMWNDRWMIVHAGNSDHLEQEHIVFVL